MCSKDQLNSITESVTTYAKELFADKLKNVILFGSYARGDYDEESDIDIMVIADYDKNELKQFNAQLDALSSDLSLNNSTTVFISLQDLDTFNKYKDYSAFFQNVCREGIVYNVRSRNN